MLLGTPEYMSPEQADLTGLDVDATTDQIYSLGVLLYELLVGALPFDLKELRRAGYAEDPAGDSRAGTAAADDAAERAGADGDGNCALPAWSDVRTLIRLLRGDLGMDHDEGARERTGRGGMRVGVGLRGRYRLQAPGERARIGGTAIAHLPSEEGRTAAESRQDCGGRGGVGGANLRVDPKRVPPGGAYLVRSVMAQHKLDIPGGYFPAQVTDGRRVVYRDDATGDLIYSEIGTNIRRVVFRATPGDLPHWMPSRDFSMVALQLESRPNRPGFVAIVRIDGKGYRELTREQRPHEFGSQF